MTNSINVTSSNDPHKTAHSIPGFGAAQALDARARMMLNRMLKGYRLTQCLYVAAKLEIADMLREAPRCCEDLAAGVGVNPGALYRVLRVLAMNGVFAEDDQGCFILTPIAEWLRTDVHGSLRPAALVHAEVRWRPWGECLYSIRSGDPVFERIYNMDFFQYLTRHPAVAASFHAAMTGSASQASNALVTAYDFTGVRTVVDVGGGHGALLAAILKAYPQIRGILFDKPMVVEEAKSFLNTQKVLDRCSAVAGDFFDSVPEGGDIYILKWVLHDWNDEQAVAILRNCRRAVGMYGKILAVETLIQPGNEPSDAALTDVDLDLLVLLGGRERTEAEYHTVFEAVGLELTRVIRTEAPGGFSILESITTTTRTVEDLYAEDRGWL